MRNFIAAIKAGWEFDTVVFSPVLLSNGMAQKLLRQLGHQGVKRVMVRPEQFRRVCTMERASGIGAICRQRWTGLNQLHARAGLCLLIVEELRSPGNLGTIIRTAHACGAGGIIFVGPRCDPYHPAVVRASMGALMHLPLARADERELRRWIAREGIATVGLSPNAEALWTQAPAARPIAIVLGEERRGLSQTLDGLCAQTVRLPMMGEVDSVNVAVAAGVMLYELVRRGI
ncbi:MAG TPA: RNA methyltransferase [Tepidisphaeraceae bacterium]|nr:RNA methyltransferase [Tepidisphaeraceae bacterium]